MTGIVSELLRDIAGIELEFGESPELSIGGRSEDVAVDGFRPGEVAGSEKLPGTNLFLQSLQIFLRSLSSSSENVVAAEANQCRIADRR